MSGPVCSGCGQVKEDLVDGKCGGCAAVEELANLLRSQPAEYEEMAWAATEDQLVCPFCGELSSDPGPCPWCDQTTEDPQGGPS